MQGLERDIDINKLEKISIGLASIIGLCLMESGGADKVVRRFLAAFGEKVVPELHKMKARTPAAV